MVTLTNSEDQGWNATECGILSGSALFAGTEVHLNLDFLASGPWVCTSDQYRSIVSTKMEVFITIQRVNPFILSKSFKQHRPGYADHHGQCCCQNQNHFKTIDFIPFMYEVTVVNSAGQACRI